MPLDGHLYLASQGWRGEGTGLRDDAITRPLVIPQKKNLAGLGKDRDEAFPFWDHLFTAAARSIQLKCLSDPDGEGNIENSSCTQGAIRRTKTGILSNRRPVEGTPATSDPSTPSADADSSKPRFNLIATAKRETAKQNLYSRFFRGPVLGPDDERGSMSRDTIQIEDTIDASLNVEKSGKMSIDLKPVIEARASKRKRDLERRGDEGLEQQKKRGKKREVRALEERPEAGLEADKSKGNKETEATASHSLASVADGLVKGVGSGSERKRRKEEKKRLKRQRKKELELDTGACRKK